MKIEYQKQSRYSKLINSKNENQARLIAATFRPPPQLNTKIRLCNNKVGAQNSSNALEAATVGGGDLSQNNQLDLIEQLEEQLSQQQRQLEEGQLQEEDEEVEEPPSYDDFLLSNIPQSNQEQKVSDKFSHCSEAADLQNIKMIQIHNNQQSQFRQNSSSVMIYDPEDYEPVINTTSAQLPRGSGEDERLSSDNNLLMTINVQGGGSASNNEESEKHMKRPYIDQTLEMLKHKQKLKSQAEAAMNSAGINTAQVQQSLTDKKEETKDTIQQQTESHLFEFMDSSQIGIVNKGPRRPLSPYIFFSQEKRKELKKEHPDWNSSQIMKSVSVLWQKMSAEEKKNFQEQSKKDRERYDHERQDYIQKKTEDEPEEEQHTVLETVKNRSKIMEKLKEQRKTSEDVYELYPPHKRQKVGSGKRSKKNSTRHLSNHQLLLDKDPLSSNDSRQNLEQKLQRQNQLQPDENDIEDVEIDDEDKDSVSQEKEPATKSRQDSSLSRIQITALNQSILRDQRSESPELKSSSDPRRASSSQLIKLNNMNSESKNLNNFSSAHEQSPDREQILNRQHHRPQPISRHSSSIHQSIQQLSSVKPIPSSSESATRFLSGITLQNLQPRQYQHLTPEQQQQYSQINRSLPSPSPQARLLQYQQQMAAAGQPGAALYPNHYYPIVQLQASQGAPYPAQLIGSQQQINQFGGLIPASPYQTHHLVPQPHNSSDQLFAGQRFILQQSPQILDLQQQQLNQQNTMGQGNPQNPPLQPYESNNQMTLNLQGLSQGGFNSNGLQLQPQGNYEDQVNKQSRESALYFLQGQLLSQSNLPNYSLIFGSGSSQGPAFFEQKVPSARESTNRLPQIGVDEDFNQTNINEYNPPMARMSSTSLQKLPASQSFQQFFDPSTGSMQIYPTATGQIGFSQPQAQMAFLQQQQSQQQQMIPNQLNPQLHHNHHQLQHLGSFQFQQQLPQQQPQLQPPLFAQDPNNSISNNSNYQQQQHQQIMQQQQQQLNQHSSKGTSNYDKQSEDSQLQLQK